MTRYIRQFVLSFVVGLVTLSAAASAATNTVVVDPSQLAPKIRQELVTQPYYSIFDNLGFQIDGPKVTLLGEVWWPNLKNSAERVVANLEGVTSAENRIEVLPTFLYIRDFGDFEPDNPLSFVDKDGPDNMALARRRRRRGFEVASLQGLIPQGIEVLDRLERALDEGRLLNPPGENAWELYQQFEQLPVPEVEKEDVQDELLIALATAGDRVLGAYRRGDAVIPLTATNYQEGAQLFGRARELAPFDDSLVNKARFMEGRALVENRQYQQGIEVLLEVVAADPDAPYTYNALGIAYMEQQQWNDAIRNFRLAIDRAEKWVYPHYNLSRVYAALSRFPEAEEELRHGIALGEELGLRYSYLYYNLGILHLFQGRANEAEEQFRRAIEMKPMMR